MKGYSNFPKAPEMEPQHQMLFSVIPGNYSVGDTIGEINRGSMECNEKLNK